jgi:hypothetical protein
MGFSFYAGAGELVGMLSLLRSSCSFNAGLRHHPIQSGFLCLCCGVGYRNHTFLSLPCSMPLSKAALSSQALSVSSKHEFLSGVSNLQNHAYKMQISAYLSIIRVERVKRNTRSMDAFVAQILSLRTYEESIRAYWAPPLHSTFLGLKQWTAPYLAVPGQQQERQEGGSLESLVCCPLASKAWMAQEGLHCAQIMGKASQFSTGSILVAITYASC